MKVLVTGAAGFIGSKLSHELSLRGDEVIGIDNINDYYDPRLKKRRVKEFLGIDLPAEVPFRTRYTNGRIAFERLDITDAEGMDELFSRERPDVVVNLAAQAGVRYSIANPMAYVESNVEGFMCLLQLCQRYGVKHLVYASSSSIYGGNTKTPFSEADRVDSPVSIYAATKKCNELFAHVFSKLYHIPTTGLRYFTVYGPWSRPDMAGILFADAIMAGHPINVFNNGELSRDFTYIDDIVEGTIRVIDAVPQGDVPARVFNIGYGKPQRLMDYIAEIETSLGKEAKKNYMPMQQGDVYLTYADTTALRDATGYAPRVSMHDGVKRFAEWYLAEYKH